MLKCPKCGGPMELHDHYIYWEDESDGMIEVNVEVCMACTNCDTWVNFSNIVGVEACDECGEWDDDIDRSNFKVVSNEFEYVEEIPVSDIPEYPYGGDGVRDGYRVSLVMECTHCGFHWGIKTLAFSDKIWDEIYGSM